MGFFRLKPFPPVIKRGLKKIQWQCAVPRKECNCNINIIKGICILKWHHRESPTIAHFVGRNQEKIYNRECSILRKYFGVSRIYTSQND